MLKRVFTISLCFLASSLACAADEPLNEMKFLAGCWALEAPDGSRVEENWTAPSGGLMLATGRTLKGGKAVFFEFLRIVKDEAGIAYIAQPAGNPPVRFPLTVHAEGRIVFENPAHDYPQRIEYRKAGKNRLTAIVSGMEKGAEQREEFVYRRAACAG